MERREFINSKDIKKDYPEIIPAYQEAYADEPWYERSKCVGTKVRCESGFSALEVNMYCTQCSTTTISPAYENQELIDNFNEIGQTKKTSWYIERNELGITLAALFWITNNEQLYTSKYSAVPEMGPWLEQNMNEGEFIWMDEIFAVKSLKKNRNLDNFGQTIREVSDILDNKTVAFRTKNLALKRAANRDFDSNALNDVPDNRDLIVINLNKER